MGGSDGRLPGRDGWSLADPTVTTAEALGRLYRTIHDAAGPATVLALQCCWTPGRRTVHAQRVGDDTSGRIWSRTRRTGVNALAFRLAQHGPFFAVDADCVPSTPQTPWEYNRQWLDLVSRSGTVLFVSVDPATRTDAVDADLSVAFGGPWTEAIPAGVDRWTGCTPPALPGGNTQGELTYRWPQDWEPTPSKAMNSSLASTDQVGGAGCEPCGCWR